MSCVFFLDGSGYGREYGEDWQGLVVGCSVEKDRLSVRFKLRVSPTSKGFFYRKAR